MATCSAEVAEGFTEFLSGSPRGLHDPYGLYVGLREAGRVLDLGAVTAVTHYGDVSTALRDETLSNQLVRGSRLRGVRAAMDDEGRRAFDDVITFQTNFLSRTDDDKHGRLRGVAHRYFTAARIAQLRADCARYADELLSAQPRGVPIDFMDVAYEVPLLMIGQMLGLGPDSLHLVHGWSVHLSVALSAAEKEPYVRAREALAHFQDFVAGALDSARHTGGTALLDTLAQAETAGTISRPEAAAMVVQMLFAGHETTTTLISSGLLGLLRHRDQWQALVDDPARARRAVEELMRIASPSQFVSRVALDGVVVAGEPIEPGRTVMLMLGSANRDPDVFPDPDVLRIDRPNAGRQVGFGLGPHFCLGAALARLEAEVVLGTLAARFPALELAADPDGLEWTGGAMLRRLRNLPVRLPAERA
jgi:cytochrome P450